MAITAGTNLVATADTSSGTSYSSGSFTPTAGARLVLYVISTTNGTTAEAPASVSGHGVTWTRKTLTGTALPKAVSGSQERAISVYEAEAPASPAADTVDVTFTNSHIGAVLIVDEFPGAASIGQAKGQETSSTSMTITLGSAPAAGNATAGVGVIPGKGAGGWTPDTGATELADVTMSGPTTDVQTQWDSDGPQSLTFDAATSGSYAGAVIEITEASTDVELAANPPTSVDVDSAPATFELVRTVDGLHSTTVDVDGAPATYDLSPTPPTFGGPAVPGLAAVVLGSHTAVVSVYVRDPATGDTLDLEVLDGAVTIDRTRDVRRTVTAQLTDPTGQLTPGQATDLLSPFGNELHVSRGAVLADGTTVLADLGVFRLTEFAVSDGADGLVIDLEGMDRSVVVQRASWESTYTIAAGTAVETAIEDLLRDRYPDVEVALPTMGATTPALAFDGSDGDPWRDAVDLARAAGWELYFDASGVVVASKPATLATAPAWIYTEGEQAVLLDLERGVSTASSVYNGVIGTAEGTHLAAPLRAVAWDEDPNSPTYYLGKFGKVPRRWSTPLATSQAQLDEAVATMLDGILGANEDVAFGSVVNPLLDVNTVVEVTRERAGLDAVRVVLDVVETPLVRAAAQSASGRRRFL